MAIKFGGSRRLKVSNMAVTPVFSQVGGEGTLNYEANSDEIDISSKDDGQYKSTGMGQAKIMISLGGVCNLPDTGLTNLVTASTAGTAVNVQIVEGATVKFEGSVFVGGVSQEMNNNAAMRYSTKLTLNGAPTTNSLFA